LLAFAAGPAPAQDGGKARAVDPLTGAPVAPAEPAETQEEAEVVASADLTEANRLVQEQDWAGAETNLAELQKEFPEDPRVITMRGEVFVAMRKFADAVPLLQKAVELKPDEKRIHFQLATALQATGKTEPALEAYAREIELNDDVQVRVMAHLNRAMLLEGSRNWTGAAAELESVLAIEPGRKPVYGHLATLYQQADKLDEAAGCLERGLMNGYQNARMYFNLGARYFNAKADEAAIKAFQTALEIDPKLADAEKNLAGALDRLGRSDEAAQHLRRYLELRPNARDAETIQARIREIEG
jgi:tetratricopeptide (TPR) repeat protein